MSSRTCGFRFPGLRRNGTRDDRQLTSILPVSLFPHQLSHDLAPIDTRNSSTFRKRHSAVPVLKRARNIITPFASRTRILEPFSNSSTSPPLRPASPAFLAKSTSVDVAGAGCEWAGRDHGVTIPHSDPAQRSVATTQVPTFRCRNEVKGAQGLAEVMQNVFSPIHGDVHE